EVLEGGIDSSLAEEDDGVFGVFVEVGVEDALVHEARIVVEEQPAQVMQLERRENVRITLQRLLETAPILAHGLRSAGLQVGDDGEAVARGCARKDRAVLSLRQLVRRLGERDCLWCDVHEAKHGERSGPRKSWRFTFSRR